MTRRRIVAAVLVALVAIAGAVVLIVPGRYAPQEPLEVVVILKATSPQMEFWQVVRQGIEAAAAANLVETSVVGPWLEQMVEDQIRIVRGVVAQRPDGIVLAASDFNRLEGPVQEAIAAGIPVVTVDSDVAGGGQLSFVGTNNVEAGRRVGEEMMSLIDPAGTVAIVSHVPGAATAIEREAGAADVLRSRPTGRTLGPFYAMNDEATAAVIVERLLREEPNLAGIVALNETSTIGVAREIERRGRAGTIRIVGFDASMEEVALLERGVVDALIVQKPFNMGYLALETLADAIRGEVPGSRIDTGSEVVRRSNMFDEEIQRLIFPLVR